MLRETVQQEGVIPFVQFMELALYCPEIGYYERDRETIGRAGDFFTSASVGPLFGQLLAFQFAQWLDQLPGRPLQLVEGGAHQGQLAGDILQWLGQKRPDLLETLQYWIIEPSARRQSRQRERLKSLALPMRQGAGVGSQESGGSIHWIADLAQLPGQSVNGVIFSNELFDAFPVHRLGWDRTAGHWFEWGVALHAEQFVWKKLPSRPPSSASKIQNLKSKISHLAREVTAAGLDLPSELLAVLPEGFVIEVSPAARHWWREAATSLRHGKLLTLDYGFDAEQFFLPERAQGTLRAYSRHRVGDDVLAEPGEKDLTAHVNFTQLQRAGESAGLQTTPLLNQAQFLTAIARQTWEKPDAFDKWTPLMFREFQTLTHPEHLGRPFRVLIQAR